MDTGTMRLTDEEKGMLRGEQLAHFIERSTELLK